MAFNSRCDKSVGQSPTNSYNFDEAVALKEGFVLYPFRYQDVVILHPGTSMSVSKASDACPNDVHGLPVGGCDVRNSSNSFALRWWVFSSEVAKLKWFCFDLALKLALYTYIKKKKAKKQSQYSVCYLQGQVKMASVIGQC